MNATGPQLHAIFACDCRPVWYKAASFLTYVLAKSFRSINTMHGPIHSRETVPLNRPLNSQNIHEIDTVGKMALNLFSAVCKAQVHKMCYMNILYTVNGQGKNANKTTLL